MWNHQTTDCQPTQRKTNGVLKSDWSPFWYLSIRSIWSPSTRCMRTGSSNRTPPLYLLQFWWVAIHLLAGPCFGLCRCCNEALVVWHIFTKCFSTLSLLSCEVTECSGSIVIFQSVFCFSCSNCRLVILYNVCIYICVCAGDSCRPWPPEDAAPVWRKSWQDSSNWLCLKLKQTVCVWEINID